MLPPRFRTDDEGTFGSYTAQKRWPIIIQNSIDDFLGELGFDQKAHEEHEIILEKLKKLKSDVINNEDLPQFSDDEILCASVPRSFNEYLEKYPQKWLCGDWLFCEIYLYRRINVIFKQSKYWLDFDIFNSIKQSTFKSSLHGVVELALRYHNLKDNLNDIIKDKEMLSILFKEFIEISLWGNATDLSLLTNATLDDIRSIQGAEARKKSESKILINDTNAVWDSLSRFHNRIDFVLDNSGFELYTDLVLSLFLLDTDIASSCIFHAKDIPYMVSDVVINDVKNLLKDLKCRKFFPLNDFKDSQRCNQALNLVASTIESYIDQGKLVFRENSFWTCNLDYWNLTYNNPKGYGTELYKDLLKSDLVIFKGDLNYRKLTGDRKWAHTTDWKTAIGPLGTNGIKSLSLRTCKADVIVGLPEGLNEDLSKYWESQGEIGSWWCSSGKWAVVCYSNGG